MNQRDPGGMLQDDLEKFKQLRQSDSDTSIPAIIELVFLGLTALTGVCWMGSLFWVPDPIPGQAWMSAGMLGLLLFGFPGGVIYMLRRGGAEVFGTMIRDFVR